MADNHMPAYDDPPSYHSHERITLPPIPQLEALSVNDRPRVPSMNSMRDSSLPQPVEPPEPVQPRYQQPTSWPSSNPFVSYYQNPSNSATSHNASPSLRSPRGVDSPGSMDIDDSCGGRGGSRGGSVLSIDDPDVRMAAEALGDLRADFVQTPPSSSSRNGKQGHRRQASSQPEPLLSLLTSHPLIGPAVRTTAASYSAGKNYSPYFKTTAECVERRVTPVVNKAGTLGRATGVEGGVRWFLGGRRRNHNRPSNAAQEQPTKRRKMREDNNRDATSSRNSYASTYSYRSEPGQSQVATHTTLSRRDSAASFVESLPAYDEFKSPPYSNTTLSQSHSPSHNPSQTPSICNSHNNSQTSLQKIDENDPNLESWQQKLILTTSGLSIAMSDESLRSLRYCLNLLQWANEHISKVLSALSSLLSDDGPSQNSAVPLSESEAAYQREATVAKIAALKKDVLKTLKEVVDVVSKYAGGALPENAALLVRMHLTSLPQRFQMANADTPRQSEDGQREGLGNVADLEAREGARKVIVLAKEGLDMMSQVSGVVEGTIVSAEEWLGKLGKRSGSSTSLQDEMAKKNIDPLLEQSTYPMLPLPIRHHSSNVDFRMREAS